MGVINTSSAYTVLTTLVETMMLYSSPCMTQKLEKVNVKLPTKIQTVIFIGSTEVAPTNRFMQGPRIRKPKGKII